MITNNILTIIITNKNKLNKFSNNLKIFYYYKANTH